MGVIATASPFIAAIVFILIAPMLAARVKKTVQAHITEDRDRLHIAPDVAVPPHLSPKVINDYIEYASDAIQIIPATLLPVVGVIFTVSNNGPSSWTLGLLLFIVLLALTLDVVVAISSPADYVSRRVCGYSIAALVALVSNVVGLIVSVATTPVS